MAYKFVKITQTFSVMAIMDVAKGETKEHLLERIKEHCDSNGGSQNVIVMGGDIDCEIDKEMGKPTCADYDEYECID